MCLSIQVQSRERRRLRHACAPTWRLNNFYGSTGYLRVASVNTFKPGRGNSLVCILHCNSSRLSSRPESAARPDSPTLRPLPGRPWHASHGARPVRCRSRYCRGPIETPDGTCCQWVTVPGLPVLVCQPGSESGVTVRGSSSGPEPFMPVFPPLYGILCRGETINSHGAIIPACSPCCAYPDCIQKTCVTETVTLQGWSWRRLVFIILSGAEMGFTGKFLDRGPWRRLHSESARHCTVAWQHTPAAWRRHLISWWYRALADFDCQSSLQANRRHSADSDHAPAGLAAGVFTWGHGSVARPAVARYEVTLLTPARPGTQGGHLPNLPFSEDRCASAEARINSWLPSSSWKLLISYI